MEALYDQLNAIAERAYEEDCRLEMLSRLDDLQLRLQTPFDAQIKYRLQYMVQSCCIQIGLDLGIFRALAETDGTVNIVTLAERLGAEQDLLNRIMRQLAAVHAVDQTDKREYTANKNTMFYAEPEWEDAFRALFYAPTLRDLPRYLAETEYRTPNSTASPAQKALATQDTFFGQLAKSSRISERLTRIQKVMSVGSSREWLRTFPLREELANWDSDPDQVLFVDLGGGMFNGQQCDRFKITYPELRGRVILQDLPVVLEQVTPMEGVELLPQDFFEPQSILGAKFYYLREVLHDWSEDKCVEILRNLALALGPHSRILVDEIVLPEMRCTWQSTGADISMMMIGGAERSMDEWTRLVQKAGLAILQTHPYCERSSRWILVVGKS